MSDWLALSHVASHPGLAGRPVAWCDGGGVSRAQFLADVAAWRRTLAAQSGLRFALSFETAYDFAAALYGAWHAGKQVFLPGDTQAATLARLAPLVDGWIGEFPEALAPIRGPCAAPADAPVAALDLQATSLVIYTSGTNGEPLAITKRLSQLDAEVHALQAAFGASLPDAPAPAVFSTVSHQHIYGLLFCVLWPLAAGRPFASVRLSYPEEIAARLPAQPSVLVSSPAHLNRLPDAIDWQAARASLTAVFSSGGPLSEEGAAASLRLLGQSPREVYGSSETGGIAWRQRALHGDHWTPLPGIAWRTDGPLLSVRSAHLGHDDWWQTADLAAADGAGGFKLMGRADRIVKIEEKRVSLSAIEAALAAGAEVAAARAFMLQTAAGAKLAVVAVPTEAGWARLARVGKRGFSEALRESLLAVVERVALPRRWRFVRALPVNSQGKSTEGLLANLFRPLCPATVWTSRGPAEATAVLSVTADLAVFDGHFEALPVLPGVAQLGWAVELARGCFALPQGFQRVDALKFQRPVLPPVELELSLHWRSETAQLAFRFASAAGVHSSGRVVFAAEPATTVRSTEPA